MQRTNDEGDHMYIINSDIVRIWMVIILSLILGMFLFMQSHSKSRDFRKLTVDIHCKAVITMDCFFSSGILTI